MQHAVVGIDIAKDVHAAQITDFRGRVLTSRHLSFTNTQEGFEKLLRWMQDNQVKKRLSSFIVGLEPTGHYWFNVANWLLQQGIEGVLVNPVTTHRNKENRDNSPSKNDPKDALVIADVVSRGYYTDYTPQAEVFERIKTTMSNREYWVKQSTSLGNRIVRWIDLYFPEFRRVFEDWSVTRGTGFALCFSITARPAGSAARGSDRGLA
jgi:transposase